MEQVEGGRGVEETELGAVEEWCETGLGGVEVGVVAKDEVGESWGFEGVGDASTFESLPSDADRRVNAY